MAVYPGYKKKQTDIFVCDSCGARKRLDRGVRLNYPEAVALIAHQLMEAEVSAEVGAELHEVSAERTTHRNGYRPRPWETRVGEIELLIPRKRQGPAYFPSFLEPRRRSEQAIVAVVLEAYVNGVSTRKVDRLVEQLGIAGMTKDRVSALCRALLRVVRSGPGRCVGAGALLESLAPASRRVPTAVGSRRHETRSIRVPCAALGGGHHRAAGRVRRRGQDPGRRPEPGAADELPPGPAGPHLVAQAKC